MPHRAERRRRQQERDRRDMARSYLPRHLQDHCQVADTLRALGDKCWMSLSGSCKNKGEINLIDPNLPDLIIRICRECWVNRRHVNNGHR